MELRTLKPSECEQVAGGEGTVTFYDNDRDGKLSDGDEILFYTVSGVNLSPEAYEAFTSFNGDTFWTDMGQAIDYAVDNPWETFGIFMDHFDEIGNAVDLSGSEYIDWKTGGSHDYDGPSGDTDGTSPNNY